MALLIDLQFKVNRAAAKVNLPNENRERFTLSKPVLKYKK